MAIDKITASGLGDGGVSTADLADGAVSGVKIANGAVDTTQLANSSVTTDKITDGNVTVGKLASTLDLSSNTLTLPDGNITTAKLVDGAVTAAKIGSLPAGSVLQVVSATTDSDVSITGSSYTDSGLSASITPSSTTSKIIVLVSQSTYIYGSSAAVHGGVRLLRDSTVILNPMSDTTGGLEPYIEAVGVGQIYYSWRFNINYLDSPSTTSSVTYKTQGALRSPGLSRTIRFQTAAGGDNGTSTIILMEVAG